MYDRLIKGTEDMENEKYKSRMVHEFYQENI